MKQFLLDRLHEPSTWRGIIWCLSAFGIYSVSPEQREAVIMLAMALSGGAGLLPDKLRRGPEAKGNV